MDTLNTSRRGGISCSCRRFQNSLAIIEALRRMLGLLLSVLALLALTAAAEDSRDWVKTRKEIRLALGLRTLNEGIAHTDSSWILSNQHFLLRTTVSPVTVEVANYHAIPDELRDLGYNHIGDIDCVGGIVYGGMEGGPGGGILAAWNASDLTLLRYAYTQQSGMPWVAVDATSNTLYAADWSQVDAIYTYDLASFERTGALAPSGGFPFKEVQGGAFWDADPGNLYLASNVDCAIWRVDVATGEAGVVLSDDYAHRPHEYEMEGLTFWDLRSYTPTAADIAAAKGAEAEGEEQGNLGLLDLGVMHMFGNFMTVKEKSIHSYSPAEPTRQQYSSKTA